MQHVRSLRFVATRRLASLVALSRGAVARLGTRAPPLVLVRRMPAIPISIPMQVMLALGHALAERSPLWALFGTLLGASRRGSGGHSGRGSGWGFVARRWCSVRRCPSVLRGSLPEQVGQFLRLRLLGAPVRRRLTALAVKATARARRIVTARLPIALCAALPLGRWRPVALSKRKDTERYIIERIIIERIIIERIIIETDLIMIQRIVKLNPNLNIQSCLGP